MQFDNHSEDRLKSSQENPSKNSPKNWVDIIVLSQKQCTLPIRGHLKYATRDNLVGRIIAGYHSDAIDVCLMMTQAAHALCQVQNDLVREYSYGLIIYDSYRPLRAVKDFGAWMKLPPTGEYELEQKKLHYPEIEKSTLADQGYLASTVSNHCFGGTVDLALVDHKSGAELNMGAIFDFLGPRSHTTMTAREIGEEAFRNRTVLAEVMTRHGFIPYEKEYWHFSYQVKEATEPFDFEITSGLRGLGV